MQEVTMTKTEMQRIVAFIISETCPSRAKVLEVLGAVKICGIENTSSALEGDGTICVNYRTTEPFVFLDINGDKIVEFNQTSKYVFGWEGQMTPGRGINVYELGKNEYKAFIHYGVRDGLCLNGSTLFARALSFMSTGVAYMKVFIDEPVVTQLGVRKVRKTPAGDVSNDDFVEIAE